VGAHKLENVIFSTDGTRIAGRLPGATIHIWDARGGAELVVLCGHTGEVVSLAFSPDGLWIASGSDDKTVRVWDVRSGEEAAVLRGHAYTVSSVVFSADGTRIASGSHDGTVRVWDARTGAELALLRGDKGWVESVAFSPDGARVFSGGDRSDDIIRVWEIASGRCLEAITGCRNVAAMAYGRESVRYRAVVRRLSTVVEDGVMGQPVGWFPTAMDHIRQHPSGRIIAGAIGNHLYLITREGRNQP